nr:tripartite tricarboxylate transporter TctB family protein [Burkholderiaceae bacterium]
SLDLPMGALDEPGAGLFPILVSAIMAFASAAAMWEGYKAPTSDAIELPTGGDSARLVKLVLLLSAYFVAIPWLGYSVSSLIFCILLIRLLSDTNWMRSILYSIIMTAVVYVVFIYLLKVPMPTMALEF